MAAVNVIQFYAKIADKSTFRHEWYVRLARCARWFPVEPRIQNIARDCGLTPVDQERRGWPYGRDHGPRKSTP
jgi:hypothetical protein